MFLAGDSIDDARDAPNADDLARQEADGQYWWAGLQWFIRCDLCGRVRDYHKPDRAQSTDERMRWEYAWIAWEAHGGGEHVCAPSCHQQLDLLADEPDTFAAVQ